VSDLLDRLNYANDWQEHQWPVVFRAAERIARLEREKADLLNALNAAKSWMEEYTDPCGEPYNDICSAIAKAST
jgi:hypothetical protein